MKRSSKWPRARFGKPPVFPIRRPRPAVTLRGDAAEAICTVVRRIPSAGWQPMVRSPRWPACQDAPALSAGCFSASIPRRTFRRTVSSTPRVRCRSASLSMAGTFSSDARWKEGIERLGNARHADRQVEVETLRLLDQLGAGGKRAPVLRPSPRQLSFQSRVICWRNRGGWV